MKFSTLFTPLALVAPLVNAATLGHNHHARHTEHHGLIKRASSDVGLHQNAKRTNGQATYYAVGLGACGKHNSPGDFIVALNSAQYGGGYPGPHCFEKITICYHGKCTGATIMDECPTCSYGDLDMSEGLFKFFESLDKGVFQMTWSFGGGGGGGGGDDDHKPSKPKPKPTPKPKPPPPKHDDDKDKDDNKKDDDKKDDDKKDDDKKDDAKKDDAKKDDDKKDDDKKDDDKKSTPSSSSAQPSASKDVPKPSASLPASAGTGNGNGSTGGNIAGINQAYMKMGAMAIRGQQLAK